MGKKYGGISFDIKRECTNNITIRLYGDNETAYVTAPFTISDDELKAYLSANVNEIKNVFKALSKGVYEYLDYFNENLEIFGKQFFSEVMASGDANSFIINKETQKICINLKIIDGIYRNANYMKRKYCEYLYTEIEEVVNDVWNELGKEPVRHIFSWTVDKWVKYNISKNKIYINPQITRKPIEYLKFALLDEILRVSSTTESDYKKYMGCVGGWKTIKNWCNSNKPKLFAGQKKKEKIVLLTESDFINIKQCVPTALCDYKVSVQSITNLCAKNYGKQKLADISFDAIVFCEHEFYPAVCYKIPCDKNGKDFAPGSPIKYSPSTNAKSLDLPEELVPPISETEYIEQSEKLLKKYSPSSLDDIDPVPIRAIAENEGLKIIEFDGLTDKLNVPFVVVLENCEIIDTDDNVIIENAKGGEIYIENTAGKEEKNSHIALAYFYWKLHRGLFRYMFASNNNNKVDKNICIFAPTKPSEIRECEPLSIRERIDKQAMRMLMTTMIPEKSLDEILKPIIEEQEKKTTGFICFDVVEKILSKHYIVNEFIVGKRLSEKYIKLEEKKIAKDILYNTIVAEVKNAEKKSTDMQSMNDSFSATLKKLIIKRQEIKKTAKDKKPLALAEASNLSSHTLSRMRNNNGRDVSLQMILGVCCGLNLSLPETEMLLDKSPYRLQPSNPEHYAYMSVIPLFKKYTIDDINQILSDAGVKKIGGKDTV